MSTPLYRFKKGTKVEDLTDFCIPKVEARKLLKLKSFPHPDKVPVANTHVYLNRVWELPEYLTEPIPESGAPAVTTLPSPAPRWRVYPKEKPTGGGSIYIAHVKDDSIVEIDCATGSFYRNMATLKELSTATTYWKYWMPESEALTLFPAVPALKP